MMFDDKTWCHTTFIINFIIFPLLLLLIFFFNLKLFQTEDLTGNKRRDRDRVGRTLIIRIMHSWQPDRQCKIIFSSAMRIIQLSRVNGKFEPNLHYTASIPSTFCISIVSHTRAHTLVQSLYVYMCVYVCMYIVWHSCFLRLYTFVI